MEAQDFEMPSPKRQKTESPQIHAVATAQDMDVDSVNAVQQITGDEQHEPSVQNESTDMSEPKAEESDMLAFLMQHVESESAGRGSNHNQQSSALLISGSQLPNIQLPPEGDNPIMQVLVPETSAETSKSDQPLENEAYKADEPLPMSSNLPPGLEPASADAVDNLKHVAEVSALPPTAETLLQEQIPSATADQTVLPQEQQDPAAREWETDSSPYSSDSSDSSDTTDSSDDSPDNSDDDNDPDAYTLLDPIEQARILMAEDGAGGDSDEEGGTHRTVKVPASLRTANEKPEDILPKPDVTVTATTPISELGVVTFYVENTLLITAKTSGEYQVLESGSVLCLGTPSFAVIGAIAETLGRVEEPLYTVRFASETDVRETFGLKSPDSKHERSEEQATTINDQELDTRPLQERIKNTPIYYVNEHSTFVFTQPLKAAKGTDASNIHDEEVGEDEMEFSDDEAEAEHKRQQKLRRKGIDPSTISAHRGGRGGQRGGRGGTRGGRGDSYNSYNQSESYNSNDNVEMNYDDVEEGEMTTDYAPLKRPENFSNAQPAQNQHNPRSQHQHLNRGNRGGARSQYTNSRGNNRGGRGRGAYNQSQNQNQRQYDTNNQYTTNNPQLSQPSSSNSMYAQQPPQQYPQQMFMPQFQMPANPNFDFQAQAQAQWSQYHANQAQQFQQHQQQQQFVGQPGFNINAEALAQVQRQLEEMRRNAGQGQGYP